MIAAYQIGGQNSGVFLQCDKPCVVLTAMNWQINLGLIKDSIVFIDEGDSFVRTREFARAIRESDNFYVIATRASLFDLPYSVKEVYGIKNTAGNKYQGTKRLFSEFYPLYADHSEAIVRPELVIVEDSNAGFDFFNRLCGQSGIPCISACGKSNVYREIAQSCAASILVIADGAAFGPELERVLALNRVRSLGVYLPESFEWLILQSGLIEDAELSEILERPSNYIESSRYFSWEQFLRAC